MPDNNSLQVHSEHQEKLPHHASRKDKNTRLVRRMRRATFLLPVFITIFTIIGSFFLQEFISKQHKDATIVNISGRQRTLSQLIAKDAIYLTNPKREEQTRYVNSLKESVALFKESHKNLTKQSNTFGFSDNYKLSSNIQNLYDSLEPYYQELVKGADDLLLATTLSDSAERAKKIKIIFEKIERNQMAFSPIMNTIVFAYDQEGEDKIIHLRIVQVIAAILVILFVIGLSIFGLHPIVNKVEKAFADVEKANTKLAAQNEKLKVSEDEIIHNTRKLQAINDNLFETQRVSEEKQQLLNRAEEIAQMGSFNFDLETQSYSYSENLVFIFGLDDSKMTSPKRHIKYIHEEQRSKTEKLFIELKQGKIDSLSETIRFKGEKHEEWKFLKLVFYLLRDSNGNPVRILGVIQDITETEINKKLAERSQKQLQSLTSNLQGMMFRTQISSDWKMEFISSGVEKLTGYPAKDFLVDGDRSFADSIHEEDNFISKEIEQAIKNNESYKIEYRLVHKNKKVIWVEETGKPLFDETGKAIYIDGVIMDISARKRDEEFIKSQNDNLRFSQIALQEQQQLLQDAEKMAKMGSYTWDLQTNIISHSDNLPIIYGFDKDNIINREVFAQITHSEDWQKNNTILEEAINQYKNSIFTTYRARLNEEQEWKYYESFSFIKYNEDKEATILMGTVQDVTKNQIAKTEIERKSKQIQRQNNSFVASINYAQRIQSAMLGGTYELKTIFEDAFVFFEPKDIVSGDFYWYAELNKDRKITIVGDCTGHGVPGAFMSLLGTTILNEIILQRQITTPSKILDELQKQIKHILKQDSTGNRDGMDIAVAVVDKSVGVLEFAGAKNPLVYINKQRKKDSAEANLTIIKGDNLSIGGRLAKAKDKVYTNHVIPLEKIETFYLYSDGYQDQFGGEVGGKFMSNKFRQLLYDTHTTSMQRQRVALKRKLMNWMGTEYEQIDDICVMGITI